MGEVGHPDSKMTLDVYAQLQQRVKREHGRAFDTLARHNSVDLPGVSATRTAPWLKARPPTTLVVAWFPSAFTVQAPWFCGFPRASSQAWATSAGVL
jgi:hypothetical protein